MIFILFLALILFGPKRLPQIGREIGRFMAEFKRASNNFKDQLQNEIEKAGVDAGPALRPDAQQNSSFSQTLLPPGIKSALSEIDGAQSRLMKTARMAFDAQNFTARPPEKPVAPVTQESASAPLVANAPEQASAVAAPPVEAAIEQPARDSAPAHGNSAPQGS